MPDMYRVSSYSLGHLLGEIEHGNIALPELQRPFVWKDSQVRDLFDSLYRGYPVGTLLFWETGDQTGIRQIGGPDNAEGKIAKLLIIDGQQRLTSLYSVMTGEEVLTKKFVKRRIQIAFNPKDEMFNVIKSRSNAKLDTEWISDITELWSDNYRKTRRLYFERLDERLEEPLSQDEKDQREERIERLNNLRDAHFQVVTLKSTASIEQVTDIFVRTNSRGVKLSHADFLLTLMSVHWEKERREIERFCWDSVRPDIQGPSPRNGHINPTPAQLLRVVIGLAFRRGQMSHVYNILRNKDPDSGKESLQIYDANTDLLRSAQDEVVSLGNWHEYLKCLLHAGFRNRRLISSDNALLYTYVHWLIGRRDFGLDTRRLQGVIGRWFFMAQTTGLYTTASESALERDLVRIRSIPGGDGRAFCEAFDRIVETYFTDDYWNISLPSKMDTSATSSPAFHAYWAALNCLDARLLFSNIRLCDLLSPDPSANNTVERHHLFPRAYLAKKGFTDRRQVNNIANMAFLDRPENRDISDKDPGEYWQEMTAGMEPGQIEQQMAWHALWPGWWEYSYLDFLEERRKRMALVVKQGFEKL